VPIDEYRPDNDAASGAVASQTVSGAARRAVQRRFAGRIPNRTSARIVLAELGPTAPDGSRSREARRARASSRVKRCWRASDAVLPHRRETAGRVEVVQIDAREGMRPEDVVTTRARPIEQEIGHQERPEMVHREHDLVAAGRQAAAEADPGIVDEHVDARRARTQRVAAARTACVADVADDEVHARVAGGVADRRRSLLACSRLGRASPRRIARGRSRSRPMPEFAPVIHRAVMPGPQRREAAVQRRAARAQSCGSPALRRRDRKLRDTDQSPHDLRAA
jgi:hypothetical protein